MYSKKNTSQILLDCKQLRNVLTQVFTEALTYRRY